MNQTTQTTAPAVLVLQETALKEILQSSLNELKAEIRELIEQIRDPNKDKDLLTSNDLCELLQTNKPQLWKWTQKGLLNPIRLTEKGKLFYRKSEVLESLKGTKTMRKLQAQGKRK